jgi:hypothetical protein
MFEFITKRLLPLCNYYYKIIKILIFVWIIVIYDDMPTSSLHPRGTLSALSAKEERLTISFSFCTDYY